MPTNPHDSDPFHGWREIPPLYGPRKAGNDRPIHVHVHEAPDVEQRLCNLERRLEGVEFLLNRILAKVTEMTAQSKEVLTLAAAIAAAVAPLPKALEDIGGAVDSLESKVTLALAQIPDDETKQDIVDALAVLRTSATALSTITSKAAAVLADAKDNIDENATLADAFVDRAAFDAAVLAYSGGRIVNLDGATVKGGDMPVEDFDSVPDSTEIIRKPVVVG